MAAYEVLLLNTAIPQIQAAQSGDTYVVPRDIAFSAALTLSAGTANGVPYLSSPGKVLTTGSALTFDGTNLSAGSSSQNLGTSSARWGTVYATAFSDGTDQLVGSSGTAVRIGYGASWAAQSFAIGGSEQMRLTSTGLGIGTSNPAYKLHVVNDTAATNTAVDVLALTQSSTGTADSGLGAGILFNSERPTGGVIIKRGAIYGVAGTDPDDDGALTFYTLSDTGLSGFTEKMRLDSSGNLGLGVTPSVWSQGKAFEISAVGEGLWGNGLGDIWMVNGAYFNSGWKYSGATKATAYRQGAGTTDGSHSWFNAASGTAGDPITFIQAMTLDASGNLGVGTTTLNVGTYGKAITLAATASAYGGLELSGTTGGAIDFQTSQSTRQVQLLGNSNGFLVYTNGGSGLTERARITSGGEFLVGSTSGSWTGNDAKIYSVTSSGWAASLYTSGSAGGTSVMRVDNTGAIFISFRYTSTSVGSITTDGTNVAYNTSSDYRLKDNQQPLTGSGAFIDALQPKTWDWKSGGKGVGFIAHEVQAVSPGSVVGVKDAVDEEGKPIMQAMEYGSAEFIANIIAELQSLRARVAQLEQGA